MQSSLRIVPASSNPPANVRSSANALGVHDTLQHGPLSIASQLPSNHSLKNRLENWDATQDSLNLSLQRNVFGLHAPMRRLMERSIVANSPLALPQSNIHLDILMGRDETIHPADVFLGMESGPIVDVHKEIQSTKKSCN